MTVGQLLESISAKELSEWQAYYNLEPFGSPIDDFRAGTVCSATVNLHLKKGKKPFGPADFFPNLKSSSKQSMKEMEATLLGIAQSVNEKEKKKKKKKDRGKKD